MGFVFFESQICDESAVRSVTIFFERWRVNKISNKNVVAITSSPPMRMKRNFCVRQKSSDACLWLFAGKILLDGKSGKP